MHSFNQSTNNNLRQRYLFSQTPLTAVQYYAIPSPPPLLLGPFPLSETPQTIFVLPASLPDFVPRTILQSATNSTNLQKSATAAIARSGQASRTTHALPTAANTQPYAKKLSKTSMHNENNELIRDFRKAPPAQAAPSKKVPCKHFAAPLPSSSFSKPLSGLKSNFSTSLPVSREQSRQKFKGEVEVSKQGKREIILYRISGSSEVYSFKVISTNENIKNCICRECWKWWDKYTSIKVETQAFLEILHELQRKFQVNGTDFLSDPCELDHRCSPKKRVKSKMEKKPEKVRQIFRIFNFSESIHYLELEQKKHISEGPEETSSSKGEETFCSNGDDKYD